MSTEAAREQGGNHEEYQRHTHGAVVGTAHLYRTIFLASKSPLGQQKLREE